MSQVKKSPDDLLSTPDAGAELGVSASRIQALIRVGRLPATKIGKTWIVRRGDLDLVRDRKPGRPRGPRTNPEAATTKKRPSDATKSRKKKPARGE